jgi:hypothetical protein
MPNIHTYIYIYIYIFVPNVVGSAALPCSLLINSSRTRRRRVAASSFRLGTIHADRRALRRGLQTWRTWSVARLQQCCHLHSADRFAVVHLLQRALHHWRDTLILQRYVGEWRRFAAFEAACRADAALKCARHIFRVWKQHTLISVVNRHDAAELQSRVVLSSAIRLWKRWQQDNKLCRFVLRLWRLHKDCVKSKLASNVCAVEIWAFKLKRRVLFCWKCAVASMLRQRASNLIALQHWYLATLNKITRKWRELVQLRRERIAWHLQQLDSGHGPLHMRWERLSIQVIAPTIYASCINSAVTSFLFLQGSTPQSHKPDATSRGLLRVDRASLFARGNSKAHSAW